MVDDITEKRVFTQAGDTTAVVVAAGIGIVSVTVSDDRVGEYGVIHRCSPSAIAAAGETIAVATETDVLLGDGGGFNESGFGPAVAVGGPDSIHAAGPEGRISRYRDGEWVQVGQLDATVRAIEGDFVATADGLHRLTPELPHVGLEDVWDVAVDGAPLAATAGGLYTLGNGWMKTLDGDFRTVATNGIRAHAATPDRVVERADGDWITVETDVADRVMAFGYDDSVYAVTAGGSLLVDAGEGFRATPLGLPDVVGLAIPAPA